MSIIAYYRNKIKERLSVCSPSHQMAALGRALCLGFATGRLGAILRDVEERALGQYEPKTFVHVPEYQPLASIMQEFEWAVIYHNDD
ncbi:MAG: hypothetical protein J6B99_09635 [Oscillospiraceae bacterium]|nr:hypothetical protein [Oscillospiraceae bacterium]